ncbi:MAG: helicase-related protein [Bacteroidales bacterium]
MAGVKNALSGVPGLNGLGSLNPQLKKTIRENRELLSSLLDKSQKLQGLGYVEGKKVPFAEVVKTYNQGISENEIKAWVWYKRKKGIPMIHWTKTHKVTDQELPALVKAGALFVYGEDLMPLPVYSYGNMYERRDRLMQDKERIVKEFGEKVFENHLKVISEAIPKLLSVTESDPKERPIIMAISELARNKEIFSIRAVRPEFMDSENADQLTRVNGRIAVKKDSASSKYRVIHLRFDGENEYSLRDVFVKWLYTLQTADFDKSNAIDIAEYYLYNKPLKDDELTSDQKAELKVNARNEGEKLFSRLLHEVLTPEDQKRLDETWNRMYNAQSDINHKRVPIGFECSSRFKSGLLQITPIQREGVAFFEALGSGICAFDVGVGKTMTAIINLAANIYSGKCSRPLVVVPKPTYKKWIGEIIGYTDKYTKEFVPGVLSYTGITLNDWSNLGTGIKDKINFSKQVPENSITLVTYEGFKHIGFSKNVSEDIFVQLVNILGQSSQKSARDAEIDYQKYREKIGLGEKNTVCDIDTLGFDYLVIDEAHRCKNVFEQVKSDDEGNKRYSITSAVSETGIKAFFHANYIQRTFGNNVMLLTATPFTNSPLEIYSMLSLVAYESMQRSSIYNINSFFDMFVLPTVEWTANYKEEIVEKEVIKSFTNRLILQKLIYNHILYKTGEEAGVRRPFKVNLPKIYDKTSEGKTLKLSPSKQVLTYIEPTAKQRNNQAAIVALAQSATKGKLDMGNLFRALAYSLDNALSPYLYAGNADHPKDYKEFVEESPKILFACECCRSVKEYHENLARNLSEEAPEALRQVSGQVLYMNRGKDFFKYIKEYLEKEVGYKKNVLYSNTRFDEVEIIDSSISDIKKENVKEAFLAGTVKVIIGTATIREGIDLQKRGTVIYNLYPDWNPTDIRQLEGRIWRQGNEFAFVRSVMPLVQDSMDVFVFQKLEEKTGRINDIWFKADRGNVLDVESLDPQEVKLALITDVGRITALYFDEERREVERELSRANANLSQVSKVKAAIQDYLNRKQEVSQWIGKFYTEALLRSWALDPERLAAKIAEYKDSSDEKEQIKKIKDYQKRIESLKAEIEKIQTSSSVSDNELLECARKILKENQYFSNYWIVSYFREAMSQVYKIERTILKPKRLNIFSDLSNLESELKKDVSEAEAKMANYKGGQHGETSKRFLELFKEIEARKMTLAVQGKSALERSEDFARLNYLLQYLKDDYDPETCQFPEPTDKPGYCVTPTRQPEIPAKGSANANDNEKRVRVARIKAQAKLKMLQLLKV